MGPQRQQGIYVGFDSPSVIRFLEPANGDVFKARFQDSHFYEDIFPKLHYEQQPSNLTKPQELQWQTQNTVWNDPRTNQSDDAVKCILYLNEMLEECSKCDKVTYRGS
jgi:hypothetical protein